MRIRDRSEVLNFNKIGFRKRGKERMFYQSSRFKLQMFYIDNPDKNHSTVLSVNSRLSYSSKIVAVCG